jgi:hypothetical protein
VLDDYDMDQAQLEKLMMKYQNNQGVIEVVQEMEVRD